MGRARFRTPQGRRRSAGRAGLLVLALASVLALAATDSSALVLRLSNGHVISYKPLNGTPESRATRTTTSRASNRNLAYHGGPIMPSNTNYAFYWDPAKAPAYPAEYQSGINTFFEDLAKDSGGMQNVESVAAQYADAASEFATYDSHFGGAIIDTEPYPPNGCTAAPICLTDAQLQAELSKYVVAHKLPHDLKHAYFILTPPEVENCAEATACSAGSSIPFYCAYHSFIPLAGGSVVYATDPFVTGNIGCDTGEHPNNKPSDGALQGGLSHEHIEQLTDPEINAWYDSRGEEIGDKCRTFEEASEFGTPLGTAPDGSRYNQVINKHLYWYQQEWSNAGSQCKQRLAPEPPTVTRLSPKRGHAAGGTAVTITGTSFTGASAVRFGATSASSFTVLSATSIQAVSPHGSRGTVDITVTTPLGTSTVSRKDHFKYTR
jgi:IPT/TIG domain